LITGVDGYLGWPLAQHLAGQGHIVGGLDAMLRRKWVQEVGGYSAIPIHTVQARLEAFRARYGYELQFWQVDLLDYALLCNVLDTFQPDTIVHLAEMPSAAYSMIDAAHAAFTQHNNVIGNLNLLWAIKGCCPDAHLIKLGTMGEYGTPDIDIPEGFFEVSYRGRSDYLPFPRQAGSFYHWSKVHDSNNTMFACQVWGLRATDIMQGVVFGTRIGEMGENPALWSRLDFDQCFGTVVNRFCCQAAIGHPLTLYGQGQQKRGFLPLRDSMQCLSLCVENPAEPSEYRVLNQFEACYAVTELAEIVYQAAEELGLRPSVEYYENPRHEQEVHYYNPDRQKLVKLGYKPTRDIKAEVVFVLQDLLPNRDRILAKSELLVPDIRWDGTRRKSQPFRPTYDTLPV
jgi:UDP-sulfoquinovose synthase